MRSLRILQSCEYHKWILAVVLLFACAAVADAQISSPQKRDYRLEYSTAFAAGMTAFDLASSAGRREANPLFRAPDGSFRTKRAALVGFGTVAAGYVIPKLFPKTEKFFIKFNYVHGGIHAFAATHNFVRR